MVRVLPVLLLVTALLSTSAFAAVYGPPEFISGDLGIPPGNGSWARAINDNGQVLGGHQVPGGETVSFLWAKGTAVDLSSINGQPTAIDNDGNIVGYYYPVAEEYVTRSFIYKDGVQQDLSGLDGLNTRPLGISDMLNVLCRYYGHDGTTETVIWTPGGVTNLGAIGNAEAINNLGWLCGYYYPVAGEYTTRAFVYRNGKREALTGLEDLNARALAMNDLGDILCLDYDNGNTLIWKDGVITNLGDIGMPTGINNQGWVSGLRHGTSEDYSDTRAFLVKPVPEPSSILALFIGLSGLAPFCRKRR